jgi:hypothetical protein
VAKDKSNRVGYFHRVFVAAGVGIGAGPGFAAAVTRGMIVDLAERAMVVLDSMISRKRVYFGLCRFRLSLDVTA